MTNDLNDHEAAVSMLALTARANPEGALARSLRGDIAFADWWLDLPERLRRDLRAAASPSVQQS